MDADEQIRPSKRLKASGSMNPSHQGSTSSSSPTIYSVGPLLMDAIQAIRKMYQEIDPAEQIDLLIRFIENRLHKMNSLSEAESSSSGGKGWSETVPEGTKLAAKTLIDTVYSEAERHSDKDAVEATASLMLKVLEGMEEMYWVLVGLSVDAFTVESFTGICCRDNECRQLLQKTFELAKNAKEYTQPSPNERVTLLKAVVTIVQGAIICGDYLKSENRFWSATTAASQLGKTNQQLKAVRDFLALCSLERHWDKDVFLSHNGKQKNFVRQLHRDLTTQHVSCFFDEDRNSLPLAEKFPQLILKAAESCKIAVVLLSHEFVRSKWPMIELTAFINAQKSGKNPNLKLLPIFYMISTKELSQFKKDRPEWIELELNEEKRGKWQDALKEVRSINGLPFAEDGDEVHLRDEVVKKVSDILKQINPEPPRQRISPEPPRLLDFDPVGIEGQVEDVKELLDMDGAHSALAVIVCGFGGMGKTTLAASAVQSLDWSSMDFKFCRVVIDEKSDQTSHIIRLQQNILEDLGEGKVDLRYIDDGKRRIREALKNKRSLIFIDNVVDKAYIQHLLPKDLFYGEQKTKLRIIITSREVFVKAELNIMCKEYQVKCLPDAASKSLLSKMILEIQVVNDNDFDEEHMINEVAVACRGVPLLLSAFGKHLRHERNKNNYQEALDVLREGNLDNYRDEDLGTTLMFVYKKIKDKEVKEAFLDICTYFYGWDWNLVVDILDSSKLEDLRKRTLVSKSGSGKVIVHDILRLMGTKEAGSTRISDWEKLSDDCDGNFDRLGDVKGISVNDNRLIKIPSRQLDVMYKSLRVLMLGNWVKLDAPCQNAFRNLRYLSVGDIAVFPFKDISKLEKLTVFVNRAKQDMNLSHLPSSLKRICHEVPDVECDQFKKLSFQNSSSLKSFIVKTRKSVELSEELHLPASLVELDLSRCKNLPKYIGHLTALESLTLNECKNLPKGIGHLTALESLELTRSDLNSLPQGFDKLKKLKYLMMDYCSKLGCLSEELGNVSSLESLSIRDCRKLRALPRNLGELLYLQMLNLERCINLQMLPESFSELRISSLDLVSLENIQELPNSFGKMPLLKTLNLQSCYSLISLPDSFVQLKMLDRLIINDCPKLSILPNGFGCLKCLNYMTVERCEGVTSWIWSTASSENIHVEGLR